MAGHSDKIRARGGTIALVPTMGFLHEGHLSLMRLGLEHADHLVVSIFVNPTQFGPGEDLDKYPRSLERDLALCGEIGAEAVFTPESGSMYSKDHETYVELVRLPHHLCGISRPSHFRGVATVVTKLFNIVKPHVAVFGEKDFQQLQVIRRMTRDLDLGVRIIPGPILREPDGLAMSSRNSYLGPRDRKTALVLKQVLDMAWERVREGVASSEEILREAREMIQEKPGTEIDYVALCDPETLEYVDKIDGPVLLALAVKVGSTRLIDNRVLE